MVARRQPSPRPSGHRCVHRPDRQAVVVRGAELTPLIETCGPPMCPTASPPATKAQAPPAVSRSSSSPREVRALSAATRS